LVATSVSEGILFWHDDCKNDHCIRWAAAAACLQEPHGLVYEVG